MNMEPKKLRNTVASGPEQKIVEDLMSFLRAREWYVRKIPGTVLLAGFPDLYASHVKYRQRWIEAKDPARKSGVFTAAQLENFPQMSAHGSPIWVLTAGTHSEYEKLFKPENWWQYLDINRIRG